MGIAALVLGIIAFITAITVILAPLGIILAVVGLILGIVDTVKKGKAGQKKAISIVGLVICAIMFVILIVESFVVGLGFLISSNSIMDADSSIFSSAKKEDYNNDYDAYLEDEYNNTVNLENYASELENKYVNDNSSDTTSITGSSSSKTSPLTFGEWGIASKYYSGEYVNVPVRVTNITRGSAAAQEVEEYCNSGSSIYKYEDAEDGMEWAVVEYEVDLSDFDTNTSVSLDRKITGTGDNSSVKHRGTTYIISTMNMSFDYDSGKIVTSKFATQLPTGCHDYLIVLGSSSSTQAFFQGE